jgi:hypothetical protein
VFTNRHAVASLDLDECRRLLGTQLLGRLALSVGALPAVVPVFYHLAENQVVFAVETDELYTALLDNIVAFEVDRIDVVAQEGWVVVVVGRSEPLGGDALIGLGRRGAPSSTIAARHVGVSLDRLSGFRSDGASDRRYS